MIFSVASARQYAHEGRIDEWLHDYLNQEAWANTTLSSIIQYQKPLWIGPIEVELTQLVRCAGPEESMRYPQNPQAWEKSIQAITESLTEASALPPLLVRPIGGVFSIPDGNHRHEAMRRKGWRTGWALLWCDREEQFRGSWQGRD